MKFAKSAIVSAIATSAIAAPAVVTVTKHVHQQAVVTVQGVVYYESGKPHTTYVTLNGPVNNGASTKASAATATASPKVAISALNEDALHEAASPSVQSAEATEVATTATPTTLETKQQPTTTTPEAATTTAATTTADAPATTSASSDSNLSDFANTLLSEHNKKRALHKDTSALSWSSKLADYAQSYADKYDCSGNLVHSGGPYGENLALGYGEAGSVDAWYDEISSYDWSNPGFSSNAGHFTQVVWKSSTEVGCGIKTCGGLWGDYVICSYNPAGNFAGEFQDNVQPLL